MTRFALVSFLVGALSVSAAVAGDEPSVELGPTANLGGARLLPDNSPWHEDISGAPVDPNSDAILARIGLDKSLHADFGGDWEGVPIGIPYVVVASTRRKCLSSSNTPKKAIRAPTRSRPTRRSKAAPRATAIDTCLCSIAMHGRYTSCSTPFPTGTAAGRRAAARSGI